MKKVLILSVMLLAFFSGTANAYLLTLSEINPGDPGSSQSPIQVLDVIDIYLIADVPFYNIDALITVDGPAEIIYATNAIDGEAYGWEAVGSYDPIITSNSAEIGLGVFYAIPPGPGPVAKITLKALSAGIVNLTLSPGDSFDGNYISLFDTTDDVGGQLTIYQTAETPEPATIAVLMIGVFFIRKKYMLA